MFKGNKPGPAYPYGLDEPPVWFSPKDPWTIRDTCEGCQIIGETGSSKTTVSGQAIANSLTRQGLLFLPSTLPHHHVIHYFFRLLRLMSRCYAYR
jgi:hypothetical protein